MSSSPQAPESPPNGVSADTDMLRPPYDSELAEVLETLPQSQLDIDELHAMRPTYAQGVSSIADAVDRLGLVHEERVSPRADGELILSIVRPRGVVANAPAIYMIHGGGVVMGDRFFTMAEFGLLDWVANWGVVVVSPEYRLAPEAPAPAPVEDCYAGLVWVAENADELGIDRKRLMVGGASGGGTLAAGVSLLARDRGAPALLAQMLICPMLDDQNDATSARQFTCESGFGRVCSRESNEFMWNAILGEGHKSREASPYSAPSRATDLSKLPPTFVDVGSAEIFRDEAVAYASKLWAHGVATELHVWPGGFHGFDMFAPAAQISRRARLARECWLKRTWGIEER